MLQMVIKTVYTVHYIYSVLKRCISRMNKAFKAFVLLSDVKLI